MTKKIIPFMFIVGSFCFTAIAQGGMSGLECKESMNLGDKCSIIVYSIYETKLKQAYSGIERNVKADSRLELSIKGYDMDGQKQNVLLISHDLTTKRELTPLQKECQKVALLAQIDSERFAVQFEFKSTSLKHIIAAGSADAKIQGFIALGAPFSTFQNEVQVTEDVKTMTQEIRKASWYVKNYSNSSGITYNTSCSLVTLQN